MPYVLRSKQTESALVGKALSKENILDALKTFEAELTPIDDIRSSATYRKKVASNLLSHFLSEVCKK